MKIKYDALGDVLYMEFKNCTVTTKRLDEDIAIDYDADGHVAGIEILSASELGFVGRRGKSSGGLSNLLSSLFTSFPGL
jgi:uncharacterized protein YuzE